MDYYKRYHHSNYDSHKYKRQDSRKHYHYKRNHLNYEGDYTAYSKKSIDPHKHSNLRHIPVCIYQLTINRIIHITQYIRLTTITPITITQDKRGIKWREAET